MTVISRQNKEAIEKTYKAKSISRTYIWPTEELVTTVVTDTIKTLMYDIRKDKIWIAP